MVLHRSNAHAISLIDLSSWVRGYFKVSVHIFTSVFRMPCIICSLEKFSHLLGQNVFTVSRFQYLEIYQLSVLLVKETEI